MTTRNSLDSVIGAAAQAGAVTPWVQRVVREAAVDAAHILEVQAA